MSSMNDYTPKEDRPLVMRVESLAKQYNTLLSANMVNSKKVVKNREEMAAVLEAVRLTKRPETILSAEAVLLNEDREKLKKYMHKEVKAGRDVGPEITRDFTQLTEGFDAVSKARAVYRVRQIYGDQAYQDITYASVPKRDIDKYETVKDVLRKNTQSHETRLSNMASATSQNEMGRKNQIVIGKRRQNMATCRNIYVAQQKEFVMNRAKAKGKGHGLG